MSEKAKSDILYAQKAWKEKYTHDSEFRKNVTERCIKAYENNTKFKRIYYYNNITMKSTYEVDFAKFLDENNIIWKYEPEKFFYNHNDAYRCYIPDFFIPILNTFIEVKSEWWMNEEVIYRLHLIKNLNYNIILIKEDNWSIILDKILYDYKVAICNEHI